MITVSFTCPNCDQDTDIEYEAAVVGQTHGRPEACFPSEPASIEPDNCSFCDRPITIDEVIDAAYE